MSPRYYTRVLVFALASAPLLNAQAPAPPPPAADNSPTIELTPFEVVADKDNGYLAQNTASGSRLNTSLKDTPGAISVFTTEFINDIGATSIEELSEYVMNTDRDFGFLRETPQGNNFATQDRSFRVRGIATDSSGGRAVNFFKRSLEMDTFNTERVEFTRGPNSILFGQSTAGTFNIQSKKADPRRQRFEFSVRGGNFDAFRTTVDANAPLIANKVAIRLNLAHDTKNSWRPHEFKDQNRLALATRFQLTPKTTLDLEYEKLDINQSVQRPWIGFDSITNWLALGRQIDPVAGLPIAANTGMSNISAGNYYTYLSDNGQLYNMRNQSRSAATGPVALKDRKMLYEFNLVPRDAVLFGPGVGSHVNGDLYSAFLRHELLPRLNVELAYNRQESSYLGRDVDQNVMEIVYDTNVQLPPPNGSPANTPGAANPFVGKPYVEGTWFERNRWEVNNDCRVTASYEFNLGRIFGSHRVAGLGEFRTEKINSWNGYEVITQNPPVLTSPDDIGNRVHRRTYVDLAGPAANIALTDYRTQPIQSLNNITLNQPNTAGFRPTNVRADRYETTTGMAVLQSRFWQDRIVATFGYRDDTIDTFRSAMARRPAVAPYTSGENYAIPATTPTSQPGVTRTQGGVFHATNFLSAFYNRSSSFGNPDRTRLIFPHDPLPAPQGIGQDMGLKLSLLGGRVFTTITYYQTDVNNDSDNLNPATVTNPINTIWSTLNNAGVLRANGLTLDGQTLEANGYLRDSTSHGYELEIVANLTPNWRLSLNGSQNKTVFSNVATEVTSYRAKWWPFFLQGDRARTVINSNGTLAAQAINPNDGQNTIAESLATIDSFIDDEFVRQGAAQAKGFPKYQANFRTNYTFTQEKLRGLGLGGGGRWRGKPIVGYTGIDPATRKDIKGNETLIFDFNASYRRKVTQFKKRVDWTLQLNVNNLLDEDDIVIGRAYDDGTIRTYSFQTPRTWFLTSTFRY